MPAYGRYSRIHHCFCPVSFPLHSEENEKSGSCIIISVIVDLCQYGSYIEGSQILFGDHNDKYILAQVYNDGNDDIGVTFDGSGYVRFQPQGSYQVNNIDANNNLLNEFSMISADSSGRAIVSIKNYDHRQNYVLANEVNLAESYYDSYNNKYRNDLEIKNYSTGDGTKRNANFIIMQGSHTQNMVAVRNYRAGNTTIANSIEMFGTSSGSTAGYININNNDASGNRVGGIFIGGGGMVRFYYSSLEFVKNTSRYEIWIDGQTGIVHASYLGTI